jgi:CBS domain-containing protein
MTTSTINEELGRRVEELEKLREEIRVELHLASHDLRDEWEGLERQIPTRALVPGRKEPTLEAVDTLAHDLRRLREKLWDRKQADATPVASVMTQTMTTCSSGVTLDEVARRMWNDDVGCLVVVDEAGRLTGLVTDRDCLMAARTQGRRLQSIKVDSAMSRTVYPCRPEDSLAAVEDVMKTRQLRRMPVVDAEGRPRGIVTLNDLARESRDRRTTPMWGGVTATLAAIGAPRPKAPALAESLPLVGRSRSAAIRLPEQRAFGPVARKQPTRHMRTSP